MISILIPSYNYSVVELVSILWQEAEELGIEYEIIVADDNSTNPTISSQNKKIERYDSCRFIQFHKNRGRTFTRNFLAKEAQFDWLLFLDADVLPKRKNFLQKYITHLNDADLIFGGIGYEEAPSEASKMLRWKYGKEREGKSAFQRKQQPFLSVISGALFIKKNLFLKANNYLKNKYGLDVLFTANLKKEKSNVLHIDNEVIHLGLEDNQSFLRKTKRAMETIVQLEKKGEIATDHRPIQKAYIKLKKNWGILIFNLVFKKAIFFIEKNLNSRNPSLFLFDLYRLYYFIQYKKKTDA